MHKYASVQVCKYASWKVYKYASVKVWKYANMQEYKYERLKVNKFPSMQYGMMWLGEPVTIQVCKYKGMYVCNYGRI